MRGARKTSYVIDETQEVARAYDRLVAPEFFEFSTQRVTVTRTARCLAHVKRSQMPVADLFEVAARRAA
jgi:hypothetical protein